MLTIQHICDGLDLELLAGGDHAGRPVRWVHISELPDPTPWLSGGELLLSTGLALERAGDVDAYVERLTNHGLAGMGVGLGLTFDEPPDALVRAAGERGFPLFAVPYETPFIAVTELAFTRLVNEEYAVLKRSLAAGEQLQRLVLDERGLDAIVGALGSLIGGLVVVLDSRGRILARGSADGRPDSAQLAPLVQQARRRAGREGPEPGADVPAAAVVVPVPGAESGRPPAWLAATRPSGGLTDEDRFLVQHSVHVVALELLRRRTAQATERRLAGDVLAAVMRRDLAGHELARRLAPFGLTGEVAAVVLAVPGPGAPARIEEALISALGEDGLVARDGERLCALVPGTREDELVALARRLREAASAVVGAGVPTGVGRPVAAGNARASVLEARCALEAGSVASDDGPAGGVATFQDLGSSALLLALQDHEALQLFCDAVLGPIERANGQAQELMRSLEAFLGHNGNWERAARDVPCHRHTLRHRIRRIEELTRRDLDDPRDRIDFWMALRARDIARAGDPRGGRTTTDTGAR